MRISQITGLALLWIVGITGCVGDETVRGETTQKSADELAFGPADGLDLPGADLERVQEGDIAPDFTLASLAGPPVTLSDFRGEKKVVLVFYRGHW